MKETPRFIKTVVWLNCSVPVVLLLWDAWHDHLGANPVNFAIRTTGALALVYLVLSLAVTPLTRLAGWSSLAPARKILGLNAFFHATAHLAIFFLYDRAGSLASTLSEMTVRPYLTVGTISLLIMLPLAITSNNLMIRKLGGARWKRLHRTAYLAAILGVVHYYMLVKADTTDPIAFGVVLALLLGYRVVHVLSANSRKHQTTKEPRLTSATSGNTAK